MGTEVKIAFRFTIYVNEFSVGIALKVFNFMQTKAGSKYFCKRKKKKTGQIKKISLLARILKSSSFLDHTIIRVQSSVLITIQNSNL